MLSAGSAITGPDNRGLRYGDGLFETIKYKNGQLVLLDEHFARLWKGLKLLSFQPSKLFNPDLLEKEIITLLQKNRQEHARVRLSVIRGNGGLFDTKDHAPHYIIQSWPLEQTGEKLNENGLQLCIYPDAKKSIDSFSNLKHNNFLPYLMAALHAKKEQCNDAIVLNSEGNICDTSIANLFMIKDNRVYTPSLDQGCIAGVMRNFINNQLSILGCPLVETSITTEALLEADEVFLTNSIYNMRWVAGIGSKKYLNLLTRKIFEQLRQTNPTVFC